MCDKGSCKTCLHFQEKPEVVVSRGSALGTQGEIIEEIRIGRCHKVPINLGTYPIVYRDESCESYKSYWIRLSERRKDIRPGTPLKEVMQNC